MLSTKPIHTRLARGAFSNTQDPGASGSKPSDFHRALARHPDPKEAADIAAEHAASQVDAANPEYDGLRMELPDLDERYAAAKERHAKAQKTVDDTPEEIPTNAQHTNDPNTPIEPADWTKPDRMAYRLINVTVAVVLVMSAANVYVNLVASGLPVFIEQPWMAALLSGLAPAGSVTLKFIYRFFDLPRTRRRYTQIIYALTALCLLIWLTLFAINYPGIAAEPDWGSLGQPSAKGPALVFIQLLTEILAGAALFLAAQDIALKYTPEIKRANPDRVSAVRGRDEEARLLAELRDERNSKHARFAQLTAERRLYIDEQVAAYLALRARYINLSNF